ncbi:MAG: flavin-containing monooxygenase [Burkholderiales bacterium]
MAQTRDADFEVLIVGAGFTGIGAGIRLRQARIDSFLILEQAEDLGGTWRDNTYPGIAVDIMSSVYSFSFEQNPWWSRTFAPGRELFAYAHHCARKYGLRPHLRFGIHVLKAVFDETKHLWRVHTSAGEFTARFLLNATGGLTQPKIPDIEGVTGFQGKTIHTARWDHGYDLAGKRVAVIGTGASAVQVVPAIAPLVAQLQVFQRTPIWVLPRPDREIPSWKRKMFAVLPLTQKMVRLWNSLVTEFIMVLGIVYYKRFPRIVRYAENLFHRRLERHVRDPALREKLTPLYGFGCKRPSFSNDYLRSFNRDNVELVTAPIRRVTPDAIVTAEGKERKIDVLILATGFKVLEKGNLPPYELYGLRGLELNSFWDEHRLQAYEGISVPGFPNFFTMPGPYATAGDSWFSMIEAQTRHALRCIKAARRRRATYVEVRQEAHDAYFADILRRQKNTVFFNNRCTLANSYYFDRHGDAPFLRPASGIEIWWRSRHFPLKHYRFERTPWPVPRASVTPSSSLPLPAAPAARSPPVAFPPCALCR